MYKVLIVDDDAWIRDMLELAFCARDVLICTAANRREALRAIDTHTFDLALLDIHLTATNQREGFEVLCHLLEVSPKAHAVVITGDGNEHLGLIARRLGATHFERKPLNLLTLRKRLVALGLPGELDELPTPLIHRISACRC